jgi:Flp pilus assembly protein TadG
MDMRSKFQRVVDPAMRLARKHRIVRSEEGSAIMETAMSMILLLTFLFGVIEIGFALYSYHFISQAAREGTRYAIVRGASSGSPVGTACGTGYNSYNCVASAANVQSYVQNLGFLNTTNMTVSTVWSAYVSGNSCPTTGPCNSPGNQVTVTVQYNFPVNVPFLPPKTYALSSTAAMIIQN